MDCSIDDDEYQDEGRLHTSNGLGFLGGPTWHYPEEEIEFYPIDKDESLAEDSDIESCSCSSMDDFRIAMIENFIETHDILDDENLDFLLSSNHRNVDYALSQPPPSVSIIERSSKRSSESLENDDHFHASDLSSSSRNSNSISNSRLPEIFPSSLKKPTSWVRPLSKRRRRPDCKVSISSDTTMKEQKYNLFREATLCVPFEYTTKLATFYIRRPYGAVTVPEKFRALSPVTDEEYEKNSQVSSSKTIQVAISVSADDSMMLLYGSSGVRYKPKNEWVDVPDVGLMDNPLGYVNKENLEYSLDEILEEAMFVREQYCSTIMSAALEAEEHQLSGPTKSLSPPSLAKSIVSTPPRSNYYYDGSGHDTSKIEEESQEEIEARKLDFMNCISPSFTRGGSIQSTSNFAQKQRKRRRKQVYRFFQRLVFVIGFYICAIFLVGNLFGVDIPSKFVSQSTHNPVFATFFQKKEMKPETEIVAKNERIERDHDVFAKKLADERDSYKRNLETTQALLREQQEQNHALSEKYAFERKQREELQREQENAATLVRNLLDETETLAEDLETEQGENRKLEQTIRELELQLTFLIQDKIRMEEDLREAVQKAEESEKMVVEFSGENRSLENDDPIYENEELVGGDELFSQDARHSFDIQSDKNNVQVFSSLRTAVTKNFQKILRQNKRSDSQLDWPRENLNSDAFLAQYRPLKFLDDNKAIREILKTSTRRVLKQSKDNSDMVLHSVKHNVDEVSIAGIKKMDHGQEAIKVVGEFAKKRLGAINRRAKRFGRKWGQNL